MDLRNNMHVAMRELIANYDTRIIKIGDVITTTYDILEDCRERRKNIREDLKDTFARTKSLRKKDFDDILQDLQYAQRECETQIKESIRIFTFEYKNLVTKFLESLTTGKIKQSIEAVSKIEKKEAEIQSTLISFRSDQEKITKSLKAFLENSEKIRIKDFKVLVGKIRDQQRERNAKIKKMLVEIASEHSQMREIWNTLPENKLEIRDENLNHSDS